MVTAEEVIDMLHQIDDGLHIGHDQIEMHEPDRLVDRFRIRKDKKAETLAINLNEWEPEDLPRLRDEGITRWYKDAPDDVRVSKGLLPRALESVKQLP